MPSKNLVAINMVGGMDALNFLTNRDSQSVSLITGYRQAAPANILDYTEAPSYTTSLTVNSNTFVLPNSSLSGVAVGRLVYGEALPRQRALTVTAVADNGNGTSTITISGPSFVAAQDTLLYFSTTAQLFKLNESPSTGKNPALHYTQRFLADAFNVPNTVGNAGKTKAAIVSLVGPLLKKVFKQPGTSSIYQLNVENGFGGLRAAIAGDTPKYLTSHNDQQSTWQANAPEGAVKGWGGGIADTFLSKIGSELSRATASVSMEAGAPFTAGTDATPFSSSSNAIVLRYPGYTTTAFPGEPNATALSALDAIITQAASLDPSEYVNDFHASGLKFNNAARDFQPIFANAMAITSVPTAPSFAISGSFTQSSDSQATLMGNLRQIARLLLANNPNRGVTLTRAGNVVTAETEVTIGTASRAAGSNIVTVTANNHRLFTSNTSTADLTDSVIVEGTTVSIDASTPNGYKITLLPSDVDNKFTFTSTNTTALDNVEVRVRLKHNFTTSNLVFVVDTNGVLDSIQPADGYQILSVPNMVSFTFSTTNTGAFAPSTLTAKAKLINLPNQVFYTNTPRYVWDTHDSANHNQLAGLNFAISYFNSLVERIVDADTVVFSMSEFGRTVSTNSLGTDHGWAGHAFVFGKSVKGNRIYGDTLDYTVSGPHIGNNMLIPTTSVYQYGATFARWMGATDQQVLSLFPQLINWPSSDRYLNFL